MLNSKEAAQQLTRSITLLLFLYLTYTLDCRLYRLLSFDADYTQDRPRSSKDPVTETLHPKTPFVSFLSQFAPHPGFLHNTRVSRS
jgi:hypothetical protein